MKKRMIWIAAAMALALAGCVQLDAGKGRDGFVSLANEPYPDTYFDFPVR